MPYYRRPMRESPDTDRRPKNVCSPKYALKKARAGVRLSRWELEGIAGDPGLALQYAHHVVKGRWPQGEPAIMGSSCAVHYAETVVGGRWEEGEPSIMCKGDLAVQYCRKVLKRRWEEAEESILGGYDDAMKYHAEFVRGRWEGLEERIVRFMEGGKKTWGPFCFSSPMDAVRSYMKVVGCRVPSIEDALMRLDRAGCLYRYAVGLGGRLPGGLHAKMMMFSFDDRRKAWSRRYVRHLERCRVRAERWFSELDEGERAEFLGRVG